MLHPWRGLSRQESVTLDFAPSITINHISPTVTPTRRHFLHIATTLVLSIPTCLSTAQAPQPPQQTSPQPTPTQLQPTVPKPAPAFYRNIIILDPAHGGPDAGARLANGAQEKDVTLAFTARLRTLLAAAGFTVLSTRDSDPSALLTTDQRASVANHARPLACLLLHATTSGTGVHVVTSALQPPDDPASARIALPWQTAQASTLSQSLRLANQLGLALQNSKLPSALMRASVPPIDSLTCAAAAVEIAPLSHSGAQSTPATDGSYQQQVAQAIANGLSAYREQFAPPPAPQTGAAK